MSGSRLAPALALIVSASLVACGPAVLPASPTASALASAPASTAPPGGPGSPSANPTTSPPPREAAWLPAGSLELGRPQTHAVLLAGGSVLVVGSDNVCTPGAAWDESVATEVGDPQAGRWAAAAGLQDPRDRFVLAAFPDGRALVTGGTTSQGPEVGPRSFSSTYLFDPDSRSWSRSGLLNTARSDPAGAVLADGRVLVAGGYYADLPADPPLRMLDSSELFDLATGEWSPSGRLGTARYGASAVTLTDGRVLVVGGWPSIEDGPAPLNGQALPLGSAEVFDPATGRWSSAGDLRIARSDFVLVALADGGALVAGGSVYSDAGEFGYQREPTASTERFDPAGGTWSAATDMRVAAADRTGFRLSGGRVLVAGGDITVDEVDLDVTPPALTAEAEVYDVTADAWTATTAMPHARSGASGVLLEDGSAVLVGGISAHGSPEDVPSCPVPDTEALRYVPGS